MISQEKLELEVANISMGYNFFLDKTHFIHYNVVSNAFYLKDTHDNTANFKLEECVVGYLVGKVLEQN